jgi:hypothetical protein
MRPMRFNNYIAITTSPGCKIAMQKPLAQFYVLAEGKLGDKIIAYAREHWDELQNLREGYPVLRMADKLNRVTTA